MDPWVSPGVDTGADVRGNPWKIPGWIHGWDARDDLMKDLGERPRG